MKQLQLDSLAKRLLTRESITKTAEAAWALFSTKYNCGMLPKVKIVQFHYLDCDVLGTAFKDEILLNSDYLLEYQLLKLATIHELAHVVQMRVFPEETEHHGPRFKEILESFGYDSISGPTIGKELFQNGN
jgi:hypothetical protein